MKLYAWQKDCLRKWEEENHQGIISAVTGSGKTRLALAAISRLRKQLPNLRIRIVTPTIALANQWRQSVLRETSSDNELPGFFGDGVRNEGDHSVMIYVVNSARTGLEKHIRSDFALGRPVLLICDECHRYLSKENYKMFGFLTGDRTAFPLYHCMGLSATPFTGDRDDDLKRVLGEEIYRYEFVDAIEQGVVSPCAVCQIAASFLPKEREEYVELTEQIGKTTAKLLREFPHLKGLPTQRFLKEVRRMGADMEPSCLSSAFLLLLYRRKKLVVTAQSRIQCCMNLLKKLHGTERIIIFCEHIEQAEDLRREVQREYGNISGIYHSKMSREARLRNLNAFRQEHLRILISCRALDEGLDVPDASIGIVLSSSAVSRQRVQRLGRILRPAPEKDMACLYYIYVRDSNEDVAYLPSLKNFEAFETFDLRYYSSEQDFANDLYTYASIRLLTDAKETGMSESEIRELRLCMQEGLCRSDYLLPEPDQKKHLASAVDTHRRNYWRVMISLGRVFRKNTKDSVSTTR